MQKPPLAPHEHQCAPSECLLNGQNRGQSIRPRFCSAIASPKLLWDQTLHSQHPPWGGQGNCAQMETVPATIRACLRRGIPRNHHPHAETDGCRDEAAIEVALPEALHAVIVQAIVLSSEIPPMCFRRSTLHGIIRQYTDVHRKHFRDVYYRL